MKESRKRYFSSTSQENTHTKLAQIQKCNTNYKNKCLLRTFCVPIISSEFVLNHCQKWLQNGYKFFIIGRFEYVVCIILSQCFTRSIHNFDSFYLFYKWNIFVIKYLWQMSKYVYADQYWLHLYCQNCST